MGEAELFRSRRVLLLIDFINPLDFPQVGDLAGPALLVAWAARQLARITRFLRPQRGDLTVFKADALRLLKCDTRP